MADNIMDYHDRFPGQYEGDQQRYARGMDDYYRKLNMIALREHGKHYDDLDIHAKKVVESKVSLQGSRKGEPVFQLDNGKVVGEKEAQEYQNNYVNMMEQAWEKHKEEKERKGSHQNVSNIVIDRLTK